MDPIRLIATRYLFSRKHISLITTLTLISITGVTLGTALLIVILSVFNGFFDLVKGLLLSYDPDIRIESAEARLFIPPDDLNEQLASIPEIAYFTAFLDGKALFAHRGSEEKVVLVRGIDPETFFDVVQMDEMLATSERDLSVRNRLPGILLGNRLSSQLGIATGERISLLSATGIQRSVTQFGGPRYYTFDVRGHFHLQHVFEGSQVFVELEAARRLFNIRNGITGIDLRLHDHDKSDAVKAQLESLLGPEYRIQTWYDLQKPLYDVMNLEKWSAFFILMLIVLVAVLNIIGSLTMIVIQKSRDIGALMAMGYSKSHIRRIFMRQGLLIGLIGCLVGGFLGLFICWLQHEFGLVELAGSEFFIITAYPVAVKFTDVALILSGSLLLCIGASWYPARRASALQPSECLRYE